MTITKLIKELQKIQKTRPRAPVLVNFKTFEHGEYSHVQVHGVECELLPWEVENSKYNKDGSEKLKVVVTLSWPYDDPYTAPGA